MMRINLLRIEGTYDLAGRNWWMAAHGWKLPLWNYVGACQRWIQQNMREGRSVQR